MWRFALGLPFLGLLLAGCAATQMTLAQELAWERWKKCEPRFVPHVTLKDIRVDGQVWVNYRTGGELAAVRECLNAAAREQAGRVAVAAAPPVVGVAPSAPAVPSTQTIAAVTAPIWKRGSEWAYRWESPQGQGTFVWTVDGEEVKDGVPVYVIASGQRRTHYRRTDLAFCFDEVDGAVETRYVPPFVMYSWPLEAGKTWEQEVTRERPKERQTQVITYSCAVASQSETVTVPAGSFSTWRVSCRNKRTGGMSHEDWYAPKVGQWVKQKTWFTYGVRERELIEYRLR